MKTWVVINDVQIPFHDKKVLYGLVVPFIEDLKPHGIIMNGDIVDCYSLSTFSKDPLSKAGLDVEIKEAQKLMHRLSKVTQERVWLGGNHEDRLRRFLWEKAPALGLVPAVSFAGLFGLQHYGFEWGDYGTVVDLGSLSVTHGSMVNKHSGQSARSHFDKYGVSVMIGHTHRLGIYYRRNRAGIHAAYENGCLCSLEPEYVQHPDWQNGFSVVHVDKGGMFNVQQIPIINRQGFFYGNERIWLNKK